MIEDYQAQTAALAAGTVTQVSAIYAAFQAGQITQAETAQLVASVINLANATAATLADAFISAQIEVQIGYRHRPSVWCRPTTLPGWSWPPTPSSTTFYCRR